MTNNRTKISGVRIIALLSAFVMLFLASCSDVENDESALGYDNAANYDSSDRDDRIADEIDEIGLRPEYDITRPERPGELFPELHYVFHAVVPHQEGFFVYATTVTEPEKFQFYFCNIKDNSITLFNQSLTDELQVSTFHVLPDGSLLVAGWPMEMLQGGQLRVDDSIKLIFHVSESEATLLAEFPESGIWRIAIDEQRELIYLVVTSMHGRNSIHVYSMSGNFLYEVASDSFIHSIVFSEQDRKLYVMRSSGGDTNILYLDETNRELRKIANLVGGAAFFPSTTHAFYAIQDGNVLGYNSETGMFNQIFNLRRHGVSGWEILLMAFENQHVIGVVDGVTNETRILFLTRIEEHHGPVETLRLGKLEVGRSHLLEELIANFNFYNPQYYVEIVDYSVYGAEATTRLHLDIITGNAPDLLLLSGILYGDDLMPVHSFLPIHSYIASGLLVDLAPYMYRDLDFDKYWNSAMEALFIGDASYFAVPSFSLHTLVGRSETIAAINSEDFNEFLGFFRSDFERDSPQFVTNMTQSEFVMHILHTNMEQFVDYRSGNANFDSEEFISLLEAASLLKPSETWELISLARGVGQFAFARIEYINNLELYAAILNGDIQTTGFPGYPPGVAMVPTQMFGIFAGTQNIEGAWAFIREMYEYENMHNLIGSHIPMNRAAFFSNRDSYISIATRTINLVNEEGVPGYSFAYIDSDGFENTVSVPPIAIEQVAEIASQTQALVEQVDRVFIIDTTLMNIILEELPALFTGSRTAADTARVIQSRTQIYLSEIAR